MLVVARQAAAMNNPQTIWFGVLLSPAPEEEKKKQTNSPEDSKSTEKKSEIEKLRDELKTLKQERDQG